MHIVFLDAKTIGEVQGIEKINELGDFTIYPVTRNDQRIERLKDARVVITNKVVIDKSVMDACPNIKLICIAATGMNNVDLDYAKEKNIIVKNVSGYSTESVAQTTFAMLFYLLNKCRYYDDYVKSGAYSESDIFTHHGRSFWEIKNKTFGIIGLGNIGKRVARIAKTFEANVVYFSTSGKNVHSKEYSHIPLNELLTISDIVSVHCPLNEKTKNLIDYQKLKLMKPSAYIINAGRGSIINEYDLAKALNEKIIAGAALDVLEHEPIRKDNPLLSVTDTERIYIAPHIAWTSIEARELLIDKIYSNIKDFQNLQS